MTTVREWTDVPEEMSADYYWKRENSPGKMMAKSFNLPGPTPVLGNTVRSGSMLFIFQSQGRCYLWNMVEDTVWKITETDKEKIKNTILTSGVRTLEMSEVEPVE